MPVLRANALLRNPSRKLLIPFNSLGVVSKKGRPYGCTPNLRACAAKPDGFLSPTGPMHECRG
jgi:hypothetical protein